MGCVYFLFNHQRMIHPHLSSALTPSRTCIFPSWCVVFNNLSETIHLLIWINSTFFLVSCFIISIMFMFLCSAILLSTPPLYFLWFKHFLYSELNLLYCFSWTIFFSNLLLYFINIHTHTYNEERNKNREMAKRKNFSLCSHFLSAKVGQKQ